MMTTTKSRNSAELLSDSYKYVLARKLNKDDGPSVFDAVLSPLSSPGETEPVVVKCVGRAGNEIEREYESAVLLQREMWSPLVIELFKPGKLTCISMERLSYSLLTISQRFHLFSFRVLKELGLRMLKITKSMHSQYGLGHRNSVAHEWVIRDEEDDASGLVLVGLHSLRPLTSDPQGYHVILELQQLVLNLRFLRDLDRSFYSVKKLASKDITRICPSAEQCPGPLRDLIQYAFSIDPEVGAVPVDIYDKMEQYIKQFSSYDDSKLPVWLREIPASVRASIALVPDPALVAPNIRNPWAIHPGYGFYEVIGAGDSGLVYEGSQGTTIDGRRDDALKCREPETINAEFNYMQSLQQEKWVPVLYDLLEYTNYPSPLNCIVMERLSANLHTYSTHVGLIEFPKLMIMGLKMLDILQSLHHTYGIVHGDASPTNWMVRNWDDLTNLALIDYGTATIVFEDTTGAMRRKDVQHLVLTLRYLRDLDVTYYNTDGALGTVSDICPSTEVCPPPLNALVEFVFSAHDSIPNGFYDTVRGLLKSEL